LLSLRSTTQLQLHFQRSLRRFILITQLTPRRTKTETVSRMEKLDHLIVVAAISQWCRRFSACVMAQSGHFEHILWQIYMVQCVKLMLTEYMCAFVLFTVWVFVYHQICNLSETFYHRTGALVGSSGALTWPWRAKVRFSVFFVLFEG